MKARWTAFRVSPRKSPKTDAENICVRPSALHTLSMQCERLGFTKPSLPSILREITSDSAFHNPGGNVQAAVRTHKSGIGRCDKGLAFRRSFAL